MKQWFQCGINVEVSALLPENDVLQKEGARRHMLAELLVFVGQEDEPPVSQTKEKDSDECRKESSDTPCVELFETEVTLPVSLVENPADEVTADHKEDINADKTRTKNW